MEIQMGVNSTVTPKNIYGHIGEATSVGFFFLNIVQIVTITVFLVFAVSDIYRRTQISTFSFSGCPNFYHYNSPRHERDSRVDFMNSALTDDEMKTFRDKLTPSNVTDLFWASGCPPGSRNVRDRSTEEEGCEPSLLQMLKNGHDRTNIQSVDIKSRDLQETIDSDFRVMCADPVIYFSGVSHNYVYRFSPFVSRRFKTPYQLNRNLVYPHGTGAGRAFVLPNGIVINKEFGMDGSAAFGPP